MKKDIDVLMKNYFSHEVGNKQTPSMPAFTPVKKLKIKWENIFMAACITGCFTLLLLPSTYDSAIRKTYVPMSKYEAFKEEFPRVIFDASLYYKEKKGVKND